MNVFKRSKTDFERNAMYDAVLLTESSRIRPEVVYSIRNGSRYVYFEHMNWKLWKMAYKMGLVSLPHKSHRYVPATYIFRAKVHEHMPMDTLCMIKNLISIDNNDIEAYKATAEYTQYVSNYKSKLNQKTK